MDIVTRALADARRSGTKKNWGVFLRALRDGDNPNTKYFRKRVIREVCGNTFTAVEFEHYWATAKYHGFIRRTTNGHFIEGLLLGEALK